MIAHRSQLFAIVVIVWGCFTEWSLALSTMKKNQYIIGNKIGIRNINSNNKNQFKKSDVVCYTIAEFSDIDTPDEDEIPVKTYGYEGSFQVGDVVKVNKSIKIWSVKQYSKEGFDCKGYVGKVNSLALYGRKFKTLCSAITPVRVEFEPSGEGVPPGMFERKWIAHFAGEELELIKKAIND